MRLLRTAAGGFVNSEKIVHLSEKADGWVAVLAAGEEVALAQYYGAPGRIDRELPDLIVSRYGAPAAAPEADCAADACCGA